MVRTATAGVGAIVGAGTYVVATAVAGGSPTLGGFLGAAAAGAISGLTMQYAVAAASGGSIAGAGAAIATNARGGALAGAVSSIVQSGVDKGSLPTVTEVSTSMVTGAALQSLAPGTSALGRASGVAVQSAAIAGGSQGAARAAGNLASDLVEHGLNVAAEALTQPPPKPQARPTNQPQTISVRATCSRDGTTKCQ